MANIALLNSVYNHYLTTYAPKGTTQYDTHKKSELRSVYNSIVKQNREAPLCIVNTDKDAQEFAVNMKENAREMRNTIASLGGVDQSELLGKKIAYSSNEDMVSATYIGENDDEEVPSFQIEVKQLAEPQYNTGNYMPSAESVSLPSDTYSFDVRVNDTNYEFQFNVKDEDTNLSLQQRLANLVNNIDIGLNATVLDDAEGNSSLQMQSNITGLPADKNSLFTVSDDKTSKKSGVVDYLGIADITRSSKNAVFSINGSDKSALSNHFTVEKTFELNLNGVSPVEGQTATIGVKEDTESLKENIVKLVGSYNDFIKSASTYLESQPLSNRLVNEMNRISRYYSTGLQELGVNASSDGTLTINEDTLSAAIEDDDKESLLSPVMNFTNSLLRKTSQVSLNPMNYVSKTVVAYKNPEHNFTSPYVTSAYSGMMFNSYC